MFAFIIWLGLNIVTLCDKRTAACSECRQLKKHEAIELIFSSNTIESISASKSVGTTSQDISRGDIPIKDLILCGCLIMSPAALLLDPYPSIIRV